MINILEEYDNLLKINCSKEKQFQYFLLKADLEYKLGEIKESYYSLSTAIENIVFDENALILLFRLTTLLAQWDNLFKIFKEKNFDFKDSNINSEDIKNILILIKSIIDKSEVNVKEILNSCSNDITKSICTYLVSLKIDDENLKKEYCKVALKYWKDNLAANEIIVNLNGKADLNYLYKLLTLNKITNVSVEDSSQNNPYDLKVIPLGGGNEIGASCYYLESETFNIMIDCGMKINGENISLPDFKILIDNKKINDIEYVLVTHAHLDHCGAILELYRLNKNIKLIMTKETRELVKANFKLSGIGQEDLVELEELLLKTITLDFNKELPLKNSGISIEFYRAGHILGAASIMIRSKRCNIFVTGDFSVKDQSTVQGIQLPDERIDVLITESTYGNKNINNSFTIESLKMSKFIKDKLQEGKQILIPAFSIGRSQEVINIINKNIIDKNFRTYIDGGAIDITKIYEKHLLEKIIKPNNYYVKYDFYSNKEEFIEEEVMNNTCCIVSSSGMLLDGSASFEYAKSILSSKNGVCILTGYQAEGTNGARLKDQMDLQCDRYINLENHCHKINAELKFFNLSAHADLNEIMAVQIYLKAKNVVLVHGDYEEKVTLIEENLRKINGIKVYQSINGEEIRINS